MKRKKQTGTISRFSRPQSVKGTAARLGVSLSTAQMLIDVWVRNGWLVHDPVQGWYTLSPKAQASLAATSTATS